MGFKCGIVGLPNVGKSTLFNALTSSKNAQAANFPFCTIDPNIGIVDVPDKRLDTLSSLSKSKKKINANITFVDIAGLVKGASKGEGLGNKFLSHIREVDAIVHLVRCFDSEKIQKSFLGGVRTSVFCVFPSVFEELEANRPQNQIQRQILLQMVLFSGLHDHDENRVRTRIRR